MQTIHLFLAYKTLWYLLYDIQQSHLFHFGTVPRISFRVNSYFILCFCQSVVVNFLLVSELKLHSSHDDVVTEGQRECVRRGLSPSDISSITDTYTVETDVSNLNGPLVPQAMTGGSQMMVGYVCIWPQLS